MGIINKKRIIVDALLKEATDSLQRVVASKDSVDIALANSLLEGAVKMREDEKTEQMNKSSLRWTH